MKQIKIALARFYNAKFVEMQSREEIVWEQMYRELKVIARLSKTTSYCTCGPVTLKITEKEDPSSGQSAYVHPGPEKYPAELYVEIMAFKFIEVTDQQHDLLQSGHKQTIAELLKQFTLHEPEMKDAIDYCAGMIGLRVNPELVTIPIFEVDQRYLFMNEKYYAVQAGLVVQTRSVVNIIHEREGSIAHNIDNLKLEKTRKVQKATDCLSWLLRGWSAEDYVLRFISFFAALEFVMPAINRADSKIFYDIRTKLLSLINESDLQHELTPENHDLFLFKHPPPVSLIDRFKELAAKAKLNNWEKDIEEFKEYNSIRNAILHRGDPAIAKQPHVDNKILKSFEVLAQKYIRYILYGSRKNIPANTSAKAIVFFSSNFKE